MLLEELIINIPNLIVIQSNTDGITLQFDKKYLDKLEEIKTNWEKFMVVVYRTSLPTVQAPLRFSHSQQFQHLLKCQ